MVRFGRLQPVQEVAPQDGIAFSPLAGDDEDAAGALPLLATQEGLEGSIGARLRVTVQVEARSNIDLAASHPALTTAICR